MAAALVRPALRLGLVIALAAWSGPRVLAQQPDTPLRLPVVKPVVVPTHFPVYLLNGRLLVGDNGLRALGPHVRSVRVHQGGLTTPARWRSLAPHGVLVLKLKKQVRLDTVASKSQAQIRRELQLPATARIELEGLPLEDPRLRIATAAIAGLDVKTWPGTPPVINVRIVRLPSPPPPSHPPGGIIRIRGLAQGR